MTGSAQSGRVSPSGCTPWPVAARLGLPWQAGAEVLMTWEALLELAVAASSRVREVAGV